VFSSALPPPPPPVSWEVLCWAVEKNRTTASSHRIQIKRLLPANSPITYCILCPFLFVAHFLVSARRHVLGPPSIRVFLTYLVPIVKKPQVVTRNCREMAGKLLVDIFEGINPELKGQ
jgi:hypothetical protein